MYLKIIIDKEGNTQIRQQTGDLNINCPYCSYKNKYYFKNDSNLFCNNCGKLLITRVEDIDTYTEEEIEEFIQSLKYGASVMERRDATICLGTLSNHSKKNIIINLLDRVSKSDPDSEVRDNAKEALEKLTNPIRQVPVIEKIEVYKEEKPAPKKELPGSSLEKDLMSLLDDEDDEGSKNTIKKENQIEFTEIQSSPYRTLKLPKPIFKKNISDSNEKKKKPSFDMADDLLSLLEDD